MPDAPALLVGWLNELGWCLSSGMGICPLTAQEIRAWAAGSCRRVGPWEFTAMLEASRCYVHEYGEDKPTPPDEDVAIKALAVGKFSALAKAMKR